MDIKDPCPGNRLGQIVSSGGITVDPVKVQEVTSWLTPRRLKGKWNEAIVGLEQKETAEVDFPAAEAVVAVRPSREVRRPPVMRYLLQYSFFSLSFAAILLSFPAICSYVQRCPSTCSVCSNVHRMQLCAAFADV